MGADIAAYWKVALVLFPIISGGVGYFVGLWKSKAEIKKLEWELTQAKQVVETKSIGQFVLAITEARKIAAGTRLITFSEDDLRESVGAIHAPRLHAALDMLRDQGKAKKANEPGYWIID